MKNIRLTTLDYAILGLLLDKPMSGYEIRKVFETTAMGNYSSSPGSIYPAIKKLEKAALINHIQVSGYRNGQFQITELGRVAIKEWLLMPFDRQFLSKKSEVLLLRFAFMDHLVSHDEKVWFLRLFIDVTNEYLSELQGFYEQQGGSLPLHGRLSFEYGLISVATQLEWAKSSLTKILEHKPS